MLHRNVKKYDTLLSTVGSIGAISMYLLEEGNVAQNVIGLFVQGFCFGGGAGRFCHPARTAPRLWLFVRGGVGG
jgi:hypothetical protein